MGRVTLISVIIPTVAGREDHYDRCASAYLHRTGHAVEIITETGHATCGLGWQAGAERATGDYLHFTCDDIEPLPGWDQAAIAAVQAGCHPAPRVTDARTGDLQTWPAWGREHPDGTDAGFSALPFLSRPMWEAAGPCFTGHYYSDNWLSDRARAAGWVPLVVNRYAFRHHWAEHLRGAGMGQDQRLAHDRGLYDQAVAMAEAGEWREPWPA